MAIACVVWISEINSRRLLPMHLGQVERRTHDYKAQLAALDVKADAIIGKCMMRHYV